MAVTGQFLVAADKRASPVIGRLAEVDPDLIVTVRPVRRFPVYKNLAM